MYSLVPDLILRTAQRTPDAPAVSFRDRHLTYAALAEQVTLAGAGLIALGLRRQERVAVYLPKRLETVTALFGTSLAGGVFVPVNPLLRPEQVAHIAADCNVRFLVSTADRLRTLQSVLSKCPDLQAVIAIDDRAGGVTANGAIREVDWSEMLAMGKSTASHLAIDTDMAAILYTSGSTGKPKGVVLSHRNLLVGAASVAEYLRNVPNDRLLAALPLSFDYGLSQLTTAFLSGASVVLMDYLMARDVVSAVARERITGLAGVPPLWIQIAELPWPGEARRHLRYITNSGGKMPLATLRKLRAALPDTLVYLMYGLTEAFRSTYLPPAEIERRPESIGRAIPNAEILVVRPDGSECAPEEPGELVHRGSLVAMGYWNDAEKTAERFKPLPAREAGLVREDIAVWSGDTVRRDAEGFLYFIGRRDEMIKTSGYRVSPTEVEEVIYATGLVADAVALGVSHPVLGQAIVVVASPAGGRERDQERVLEECRQRLPPYMVPHQIFWRTQLPRNPNGKFDRTLLGGEFRDLYADATA